MIRLSGIPRMYIASPNATVIMGIELSVSISKGRLNDCLQKINNAHPIISKTVEINEFNDAYLTEITNQAFEIIEYDQQLYEVIANNQLKEEWNLDKPLIKFIINHLNTTSCQVIISANHSICDGLSMVYLLQDIAAYLSKAVVPEKNEIATLHPDFLKKRHWLIGARLFAFLTNSKLKKGSFRLSQAVLSEINKIYWRNHRTEIHSIVFDERQTAEIINAARKNNVTVNTYLTNLLYESQLLLPVGPFQHEIMISLNLRDKLTINPGKQFGYFVTGVRMNLAKFSKSLSRNAFKELQYIIKEKLRPRPLSQSLAVHFLSSLFLDLVQLNKFGIRNDRAIQKFIEKKRARGLKTAIAFTNLGVLKLNEDSKDILSRFLPLVLVLDNIEKYVSAFTYKGQLHMAVCYDSSITSKDVIDIFVRSLKKELKGY